MKFSFKRRGWDSNPRALADKRFSRPPRYDHFDTSAQCVTGGSNPAHPDYESGALPNELVAPILFLPRGSDSNGNRTRVTAVKGRCLNRLTMEPDKVTAGFEPAMTVLQTGALPLG